MLMVEKKKNPFSFSDPGPHLLHIQVEDNNEADLYSKFQTACTFIGKYNHWIKDVCFYVYLMKKVKSFNKEFYIILESNS